MPPLSPLAELRRHRHPALYVVRRRRVARHERIANGAQPFATHSGYDAAGEFFGRFTNRLAVAIMPPIDGRVGTKPMRIVKETAARFFAGALLMTVAVSAAAQEPPRRPPTPRATRAQPEQAPAKDEAPQRTTATYEDWVVQCETRAGPRPEKVCDMAQVTQVRGKNIPFSRVAIAYPAKGHPVKLVVQLPVNASFLTNVRIQTSDFDPGLAAPFARCVPVGCFADFDLAEDTLKKFRAAFGTGKLSFTDATRHDVVVPLSFKGFGQAFDALAKE